MSLPINQNLAIGATSLDPNETSQLKLKHITSLFELDEAESMSIARAHLWLRKQHKKNPLTVEFLLKLHEQMFQPVWGGAGVYRSSDKNIGVESYMVAQAVAEHLQRTQSWIEHKRFGWVELGARFHHRLVEIHPFANGNGRHARLFTDFLLNQNKQDVFTWGRVGTQSSSARDDYINALRQADLRNFEPLIRFVTT
jgi:Fic-DOC domain mobile mystery protein B